MKKIIKYILLFTIFLILPLSVNAEEKDIKIESIELVETIGLAEEKEKPTYENLKIDFNLKFEEVNDSIKYKVTISNTSDKEYKIIDEKTEFTKEQFISYDFSFEKDTSIIEPNNKKQIFITITYFKEVEDDLYIDGVYKNDNYMNLNLTTEPKVENVTNPETGAEHIIFIISFIIFSIIFVMSLIKKKNKAPIGMVLLLTLMIVPFAVTATEKIKLEINTYVEIEKPEILNFTLCDDVYQFEERMTLSEWFKSEFNINNITVYSETGGVVNKGGAAFLQKGDSKETVNFIETVIEENSIYKCDYVAECVSPESKILTSFDGITTLAKNIKENDQIIYYDETEKENKIGKVKKVYIHKDATNFIKYEFEDNTYLEATDYHPIYTKDGWKSYTNRKDYEKPNIGDKVKTNDGWKKITKIKTYKGKEDFYDFSIITEEGKIATNYYANDTLVEGSY